MFLVFGFVFNVTSKTTGYEWEGWVTKDGKPVQNTDSMKSIGGFGGWLIVTPDLDWAEKWNTPTEHTPSFRQASKVKYGQELVILTFFINPKLNVNSEIDIVCDTKIKRPDGTYSIDTNGIQCANGKLNGSKENIRLASTVIKFVGESNDMPGVWEVDINLVDKNRNINLPLKTKFELVE